MARRIRFVLSLPLSLLLVLPTLALTANAATEERTTIQTMGKPSGFQTATYADDGTVTVRYEFNDRGRGPEIDATYTVDAQGVPTAMRIAGKNYLKLPVEETFTFADGKASWRNGSDDAEVPVPAARFYTALNGPPEEFVLLARALLAAPDHRLPLLPSGDARISEVATVKVKGKGGPVVAHLYAVEGLDLAPAYLWLDEKGRFFATYSSWQSRIREGYEAALATIGKAQDAQEKKLVVAQAHKLTHVLKAPLLIEPVRLFDPDTLKVTAGQGVLVVDGKIAAVGAAGSLKVPAGTETLDGKNLFLSPGLWDMHAHYSAGYTGLIDLAGGVTSIRDLANDTETLARNIADIEAGDAVGPRIVKAGFIDGRGPYAGPTKVFADDEKEARAAVDQYAKLGYEQIKVYSSLKPELVAVIAKAAHAHGMLLSGHVPAHMSAQQFVEAGADEIQHINFILMSFVTDVATADTRTPVRFTAVAENAAKLDLGSPEIRAWVDFLVAHKTVVDPTVSTFEDMFNEQPGHRSSAYAAWIDRVPASWKRALSAGTSGLPMTREQEATFRESYAKMVEMIGMLYRSGVTIVAGTDGLGGFQLVRELELYVNAGIPPAEALRIATRNGAVVMKRGDRFGRIAPGYVADLMLVDGDPTLNIADLRRVRTVVQGTRRFESAEIYEALGLKPIPEGR